MKSFRVIGLMSGTSLDGLDVADVTFHLSALEEWSFKLNHAELYHFNPVLLGKLKDGLKMPAHDLIHLSAELGNFYAETVNQFIHEFNIDKSNIDFISSHGQTVFHQPEKGYTLQIGNGPELSINTNLPTVVDFRTKDVALGGNGAPLIPVADHLLFANYADSFLNLGGFSNFSYKVNESVFSYDICPVNILINSMMTQIGLEYDAGGEYGKHGIVNDVLLNKLNDIPFYNQKGPKSLGAEWVRQHISPLFNTTLKLQDKIRTFYEHVAIQIASSLNNVNSNSTLVTGGGAKNSFLVERIKYHSKGEIIVPDIDLIDYKEAIGFAFLGVLKWQDKINVWSSVTGSKRDSSSGVVMRP